MGGAWRRALACGCGSLLAARGLANPLESLDREHWVSLDSTATDQATDVATGAGGSMVYISGYRQRAPTGADGTQSIEAFVMAYNSSGFRQWVAEYGSSGEDLGNSVAADATGVYLAGTESVPKNSSSSSGGGGSTDDTDAFVVKYNSTGGLLWKTSWGTSQPDLGNGVAVDGGSGLVYVVGTTRGSMPSGDVVDGGGSETGDGDGGEGSAAGEANTAGVNAGMSDVFLTCLSAADGGVQWTRQFGSSAVDVGNRVAVGPRGGVFAVGQLGDDGDSSLAGQRAFLAKYDYLGNAQFTARLNSSSAHYAVDLAPSVGSGGEGVVYMSGYTLGDSPSVFLARFEGSTGTQTWLSELGEETGMPHLAQSVAVVEGSQFGFGLTGGGAGESQAPGSDGTPVVEGEEATHGNDARIVVVGYNTSAAAADSHSSTGFTAAADTDGNWAWVSASEMADRHTAIAIGQRQGAGAAGAGPGESVAYIVGTVAAGDASPGNYLFLDIRKVVREGLETPAPSSGAAVAQGALPDPVGGASSTTGLSQGSSLWLLIIAPIFVVLSCILLVSYVSKQCSVAFGTRPPQREPMDAIEYGSGGGGGLSRGVRTSRSLRREKNPPSDWNERSSGSPVVDGSSDRRRRRDSGSGSSGNGSGSKGGRKVAWPRSVADAFRDRAEGGPPYRKLGMRERDRSGDGGRGGGERGKTESSASSSAPPLENGEVELRQVTGQRQAPFGYPRGEDSPGGGGGGRRARGGGDHEHAVSGGHENLAAFEDRARSNSSGMTAATGWGSFQGERMSGDGGREEERSHERYLTGRPRREGSPAQGPDPHRLL